MSITAYTGPLRFVFGGFVNLYVWFRDRRPLPKYIHALGAIGALTGIWMATLDRGPLSQVVGRAVLYVAVMIGLLYVSFGYYGAHIMDQRKPSNSEKGAG